MRIYAVSPKGGGAGPAPVEESKRSEDAIPFDVRVMIAGKRHMGRWQFSGYDNHFYFVHADGEWVTPSRYCYPRHSTDERSSSESHESDIIGVVDGDEYQGSDEMRNFYFYSELEDADHASAVCDQSPDLVDNPYEDVLVLGGIMHPGTMHTVGLHYLVFEHDSGRCTRAYPSTTSESQEEVSDEDEQ